MNSRLAASAAVLNPGAGLTLFKPQSISAGTAQTLGPSSSTGVNLNNIKGATGDLLVIVSGTNGAAPGTCDAKITESATTNGTYTAITGAAITQVAATANLDWTAAIRIPWSGRLGFIRMDVAIGAGTNPTVVSGVLVYDGTQVLPVQ
jgi:hypothetical protein